MTGVVSAGAVLVTRAGSRWDFGLVQPYRRMVTYGRLADAEVTLVAS